MDTFFIIPHTHWEGAVFKTREEYLEMGLPNILQALQILKTQPEFRFVLDQACYVQPFLDRYPEEELSFRQFITEGRLEIVGGLDVMIDANIPGGESFVRQVLYGKGYFRQKLGVEVTSGWLLDTFGQNAQMPQLLKLSGYKAHWFWRGAPSYDVPSEFFWEGIDGSRIPAFWLPYGYGLGYHSPQNIPEFREFFAERFEKLKPFFLSENKVVLAGVDVGEPEGHLVEMVSEFNQDGPSFELKIAVPAEYVNVIESCDIERPVISGEWNPIFQGGYSSRIRLKQFTRELESLLTACEKLGAILNWVGTPANPEADYNISQHRLWQAWEPMLFNQAHDLMSGVMTDHVYEDTISAYEYSRRIAVDELSARVHRISGFIDTQTSKKMEKSIALVVFNPTGMTRSDLALVEIGFGDIGLSGYILTGPDGDAIPTQVMDASYDGSGALLRARIAFNARDVPALGYTVYHLSFVEPAANTNMVANESVDNPSPSEAWLENEYYRLVIDPASGAILNLFDKENGWSVLRDQPGNVIVMEEDRGDLWELYRPLDGGSTIAMQEAHPAPDPGKALFSTDPLANPIGDFRSSIKRGPVFSEFSVSRPFSSQGELTTTIRLVAGSRRIEIQTRIHNQDSFVRYRVLFPTSILTGTNTHEIPFGAIERPEGIEMPAQNWVDTSDGVRGVALLNRGLPGNNIANGTIMLSLMRSTRIVAYGFFGGYEQGMSSDSGFELDQEHTFNYALIPHAGDWRAAAVVHHGLEFNNALITQKVPAHPGKMPAKWGCIEISPSNIALTTLKPGEGGGIVLRMYESSGVVTPEVVVKLSAMVSGVEEINLMEDPISSIPSTQNEFRLAFHPYEIKTVKLSL